MRTTKQVRRQFRDMQDTMQGRGGPFQNQATNRPEQPQAQPKQPPPQNTMGEYIDFEEIK